MKTRWWLVGAVAAVLIAGGLFASNMAFKLVYILERQGTAVPGGVSSTGNNIVTFPYRQQTGLNNAGDLLADLGGTNIVIQLGNYTQTADIFSAYTGLAGAPFDLVAGDAYLVQLCTVAVRPSCTAPATLPYVIVGSENSGLGIDLDAQQAVLGASAEGAVTPRDALSRSGSQVWGPPYHLANNRADLVMQELETFTTSRLLAGCLPAPAGTGTDDCTVAHIDQFQQVNNVWAAYTGKSGTPFAIVPGEGYFVQVNRDVVGWIPLHF